MKLYFGNITIDLNIFNLQRQSNGFGDVDYFDLNQVGDFPYDESEFEHVDEFPIECESFFIDNEPEYDVFDFAMCSVYFITDSVAYDTSVVLLDVKPLHGSLKYAILSPDECRPVIIVSNLDQD